MCPSNPTEFASPLLGTLNPNGSSSSLLDAAPPIDKSNPNQVTIRKPAESDDHACSISFVVITILMLFCGFILTMLYHDFVLETSLPMYIIEKPTLAINSNSATIYVKNPTNMFAFYFTGGNYTLSRYPTVGTGFLPAFHLGPSDTKVFNVSNTIEGGLEISERARSGGDDDGGGDGDGDAFEMRMKIKAIVKFSSSVGRRLIDLKVECNVKVNKRSTVCKTLVTIFHKL